MPGCRETGRDVADDVLQTFVDGRVLVAVQMASVAAAAPRVFDEHDHRLRV